MVISKRVDFQQYYESFPGSIFKHTVIVLIIEQLWELYDNIKAEWRD